MTRVAVGTVPEKVSYVYSSSQEVHVGCYWDIPDWDEEDNSHLKVFPAFPVGSDQDKDLVKAKEWAKGQNRQYDSTTNNWIDTSDPIVVDTVDNKPIKKVRLLSLEIRGQGGRAYKILIDEKYYVDLREDVLVDVMIKPGISAGGILNGEFVWAKLRNQMRLVRVGSELHKMLEDSNRKRDMPKLKKTDFEVGGVYQARNGDKAIFLGYVNSTQFSVSQKDSFLYATSPVKKSMLFFDARRGNPVKELPKVTLKTLHNNYKWRFTICTTHNYIEKIADVKVEKDYVAMIRKHAQDEIKEDILEFTGHKKPENSFMKMDKHTLSRNIEYNSIRLNMYKVGDPAPEPFDVKKYLVFS